MPLSASRLSSRASCVLRSVFGHGSEWSYSVSLLSRIAHTFVYVIFMSVVSISSSFFLYYTRPCAPLLTLFLLLRSSKVELRHTTDPHPLRPFYVILPNVLYISLISVELTVSCLRTMSVLFVYIYRYVWYMDQQ